MIEQRKERRLEHSISYIPIDTSTIAARNVAFRTTAPVTGRRNEGRHNMDRQKMYCGANVDALAGSDPARFPPVQSSPLCFSIDRSGKPQFWAKPVLVSCSEWWLTGRTLYISRGTCIPKHVSRPSIANRFSLRWHSLGSVGEHILVHPIKIVVVYNPAPEDAEAHPFGT
ncbi:hypothetical protein V6N12_023617 [Hibiscus sabdariffa]|uniref:Uncharacterized protein n=1 Tax=Hibiscus sabdariffa TaxID=183260 RepID=A0ABR2FYU5_9ROSI